MKPHTEGAVLIISPSEIVRKANEDHYNELRLQQWKERKGSAFKSPYTDSEHHQNTVYLIIKRFHARLDLLYNLRK